MLLLKRDISTHFITNIHRENEIMSILVPKVATIAGSAYVNIREFIKPFQKDR